MLSELLGSVFIFLYKHFLQAAIFCIICGVQLNLSQ
jgi:hypothetical protein